MAKQPDPEMTVNTRLPQSVVLVLRARADAEDRSVASVLRRLVLAYIEAEPVEVRE